MLQKTSTIHDMIYIMVRKEEKGEQRDFHFQR